MKKHLPRLLTSALIVSTTVTSWAFTPLPLENPGFEDGLMGWNPANTEKVLPEPMIAVTAEAARQGEAGVRVTDNDLVMGSHLASNMLPATPGATYRVTFFARSESRQCSVNLRFYDADRKLIGQEDPRFVSLRKATGNEWESYELQAVAPENTTFVDVWVHSWGGGTGVFDFDDFTLEEQR